MSYSFANPNWASWIRTSECRSQSPVPYRLAIAHCVRWLEGFEPSASRATIWRANQLRYSHHAMLALVKSRMCPKGFEPPTHGLEGRCSIQLSYGHTTLCELHKLSGWWESNPHIQLGRLVFYHGTTPACVGVTGFEPATSWSQIRRSSQAEPHPVFALSVLFLS